MGKLSVNKYRGIDNFKELSPKIIKSLLEGYSVEEVCLMYGIGTTTYYKWKSVNRRFKSSCETAERRAARSLIKVGLRELAKGHSVVEEQTEYYTMDEDGNKVKKIVKSRVLPPDIKAIRMLASKHAQGEYLENEANKIGIDIKVTQKDRALSMDDRLAILNKDKSEGSEAIEADYREIEAELS